MAIFQRGAADGLNVVVPFAEKSYYELRPTIGIPAPGGSGNIGGQPAIDLDGRFGLNAVLQPLKALWDKQMLAVVEATGSPDPSRSHFDAQDYMESGTPGMKRDGWLNRALPPVKETSPLRAISMSANLPRTMQGDTPAIAINDVGQFKAGGESASIIERMYATSPDKQLAGAGKDAFAAMRMIESLNKTPYNPAGGAQYAQGGELGRSLRQIAQLIKADAGVEAAFAEIGGWDHHQNEPQQMSNVLRQFGGRAGGLRHRHGRPHGRRGGGDHVGIRAHGAGERQQRHGSRPRRPDVRARRPGARRQGLRQVAGPGEGAALRRPRPGRHHRLPRRCSASWSAAIWARPTLRRSSPDIR